MGLRAKGQRAKRAKGGLRAKGQGLRAKKG
jgi:hypothetical protein